MSAHGRARAVRDLRERGGAWGFAQTLKNGVIYASIVAALAVCGWLSPRVLRRVGRALGRFSHAVFRRARATAHANVARAMPNMTNDARAELVGRVFVMLGEHLGEAVATLRKDAPFTPLAIDDTARAMLDGAIAEGRGVIFASAHLGPWERLAATLVQGGIPLTTTAREPYDPRLSALYDRLRDGRGVRAIYRGRPGAGARMVRVLREGGVLGIVMDLASRVPSIDAPFFGLPAPTPVGPARLALRTGAAIVVGTCAPGERAHICRIPVGDVADREDGDRIVTARINAALCRAILAMPESWVWMHDRFPAAAPSPKVVTPRSAV